MVSDQEKIEKLKELTEGAKDKPYICPFCYSGHDTSEEKRRCIASHGVETLSVSYDG